MTTAPTRQPVMSDMFVNNTGVGDRKLKTVSSDFKEVEICRGHEYVGVVKRNAVSTDNTFYSVISTGSKYLIINDLDVMINFVSGDGNFLYEMDAYVDISNNNTFTYAGGVTAPLGKPLSTQYVNNTPISTIEVGVTATVTGEADYHLFDDQLTRDTSGNRSTQSGITSSLFSGGRITVIAPNSKVLIKSQFTGDNATANITNMFYFKELTAVEFPQAEDI
jgi:hypothetical protein